MAKVRYALIGFGGIAENRVAKEGFACDKTRFAPLEYAELTGTFDLNPARRAAASKLGLKWYKSVDDLLADKKVDAVYVATNNATHAAMTIKALEAGKHVIVEKPIATSITDAKKMIAAAKKRKLSLSVDHMMVNNAFNKMAKKSIAAGKIGTVNDCCFHMEFAFGYDPAEAATWRCSKVEEMGGPIGDVASHCFYVAEYVFGSPIVEVAAVYLPKLMEIKAEDGAYIKFTMANGLKGSVKVAFSELRGGLIGTLSNLGFEIYGSEGVLRSFGSMFQLSGHGDEPYKMRLELETAGGVKNLRPRVFPNIYQTLIEDHAKSVLSGRRLTGENGLRNLELCAASHKSAKSGGKVVRIK
ncbi:MAG: Gfo/Idh/MocA family oxidoreductase [Lentisphaeria bacterium]|nr:Gfo/Idh/MocA family oxidoreductase [Lentisphaeria bacterium]